MEASEVAARVAASVADANVPAVSIDLSDLSTAFSEARMLSDQRRLADSVEGQSQNISMKVTTAPERTFGIGVDDAYRGGSTVIAEIPGVGEVEIRLRNDADSSLFQSGSEHSLDTSFTGWNGIRKRLILSAQ